jgi:hypothetical protein
MGHQSTFIADFTLLGRFAPDAGFVTLRQTFVRRGQSVPMMLGRSLLRTLSGCNSCRSRTNQPNTNRSWE